MLRPGRPHPRHKQSLIRYLFPRAVRDRYRERLLNFHLDTLPYIKHNLQSRIYRYILERQRRRATNTRIIDIVTKQGRRLWLGPQPTLPTKHVKHPRSKSLVARRMPAGSGMASYGQERPQSPGDGQRGYRRKKLAAMAGSLYRSGQAAVTEIRESYAQTRTRGLDGGLENHGRIHIPGAFPDVEIMVKGNDQLVLFPSYAKRHSKREWAQTGQHQPQAAPGSIRDEEYWRSEWERNEDERAIIDVDVRGWVYSPHVGPMTRRNRMLVGLARQLSGIPPPRADQGYNTNNGPPQTNHQMNEEQEKIAHEAEKIERLGQAEKRVAYRGGYSERPQDGLDETQSIYPARTRSGNQSPDSAPTSPTMSARTFSSANGNELTEAELAAANANLMARISPFMTNPSVALPITLFFYNDTQSQSKTVITNEAGHFHMRAALEFIPSHVRVLASEDLSATQEVKLIEPWGVSVISDIDDTVKRSNISGGAKEIFRNTFVRELNDLHIEGVREWFTKMQELGVNFHYCSNSPWQLFPVLASYFKLAGLPPGSLHLKQYSGMLQGIFEPVAERKKSTLTKLLRDFPDRKFLLVGDSGEADLEVYTDLALANPGRILAVFIRDVTTPEETGFFDSGFSLSKKQSMTFDQGSNATIRPLSKKKSLTFDQSVDASSKPKLPRRPSGGPMMGTLIDYSEEPQETSVDRSAALAQLRNSGSNKAASIAEVASRKPPPPRPNKPAALRSARSITELNKGVAGLGISREGSSAGGDKAPPMPPRKAIPQIKETPPSHPLSQTHNSSQMGKMTVSRAGTAIAPPPPPPPPRRRGTPARNSDSGPVLPPRPSQMSSNLDVDYEPLPPPRSPSSFVSTRSGTRSGTRSDGNTPSGSPNLGPQGVGVNKKVELWRRRLARAHEQLDELGVALYTWRRGNDVAVEAEAIIKRALADMDRKRRA